MDRLQTLTRGNSQDRKKYELGKRAKQAKTRMDLERFEREKKRLAAMDLIDEYEDRGEAIIPKIEDLI